MTRLFLRPAPLSVQRRGTPLPCPYGGHARHSFPTVLRAGLLATVCFLFVGAGLVPDAAAGETELPEISSIRVGFSGHYKVGVWTPLAVTLRGPLAAQTDLSVTVPDGEGVPSRVTVPVPASDNGQSLVTLYARFGRVHGDMLVELRQGGRVIANRLFATASETDADHFLPAIAATRKIILAVQVQSAAVEEAIGLAREAPDRQPALARVDDLRSLPDRWYGYEGVDSILVSAGRPAALAGLQPGSPQLTALDEWIRMGGTLVLCVGAEAPAVLAAQSPWRRFAPGRFQQVVTLHDTRALEVYAGSSVAVFDSGGWTAEGLRAAQLSQVRGRVEAREADDLPLVVRTARGFGQVVFFAADVEQPPLSRWRDRPLLLGRLLDLPSENAEQTEDSSAMMHLGFNDMAGQLRSGLDQFHGVQLVPFWLLAGLLAAYVLLIGPLDYVLLRRFVGSMQWTWVSFPAMVVAVSVAAYFAAYYGKGDRLRVNRADVVDVDTVSGRLRGTSWANILSPRAESYDISWKPSLPNGQPTPGGRALCAWLGLPGSGLGGMDPRTSQPVLRLQPYDFSLTLDALEGVPIQAWATRSFTARWTTMYRGSGAAGGETAGLAAELVEEDDGLVGTIHHRLPFALGDCLVFYDRWVYTLDDIKPGEMLRLDANTRRSDMRTYLTRQRIVAAKGDGDFREETPPYEQSRVEVPYILRTMLFFEAAGGPRYTRLANGYQGFVDFSRLLKTGRAILVAQAPAGHEAVRLVCQGQSATDAADQEEHRTTVYRFVLPVGKK